MQSFTLRMGCDTTGPPSAPAPTTVYAYGERRVPRSARKQAKVRDCLHEYIEALYDIRRFCPECAGAPVLPARFQGFDYVPYELTAGRTGTTAGQEHSIELAGGANEHES